MRIEDVIHLESIKREVDIADEAYCIECGCGGQIKGTDKRMYFFNGYGPFDNVNCFADFLGVERDVLPMVQKIGRLR